MPKNEGVTDRILRIVVGLGLVAFAAFGPETGYTALAWIGLLPLVTGLAGFCPAYALFGIKTCPVATKSER